MIEIWYPLLAAFAVMLVSLIGVIFTAGRIGAWMQRYLTYLATFSCGVFLLIAYHLAGEAVHEGGWVVGIASMLVGAALMEGIHYFFPLDHHHHEHEEGHLHSRVDARKVLASDTLHNIGDGILLVGAFASDIYVGLAATVGVLLHETVQEISEYFVLRESGLSNRQALVRNFAVSATILIGLIFAFFLSSGPFVAILSGLAAGGFLSVILHDLLPHAVASARAHGGAYVHVIAALIGAGAMFALQTALPHEENIEAEQAEQIEEPVNEMMPVQTPVVVPARPAASTNTEPAPASTPMSGTPTAPAPTVPAETGVSQEEIAPQGSGGAVPSTRQTDSSSSL